MYMFENKNILDTQHFPFVGLVRYFVFSTCSEGKQVGTIEQQPMPGFTRGDLWLPKTERWHQRSPKINVLEISKNIQALRALVSFCSGLVKGN